ncbi:MAG TPA: glycosyltransferase family 4 protein [Verrucomicrobiae bacterium]|nr:glycosyltransferase family 4 protein [Verrucomicrobiae bacterium]
MKILIHCNLPFSFTHGGLQTQIEQTKLALEKIGVETEWLRWWDEKQTGDVLHFFGRMSSVQIQMVRQNGMKVVMAELLTAQGSRSPSQLWLQRTMNAAVARFAPGYFSAAFNWKSYQLADACIALTPWEAHLMNYLFNAPKERTYVVPNGVEEIFFEPLESVRGKWLVCTATITERKRVLELARAAVRAQTPVWIIGNPYADTDAYGRNFSRFARENPAFIRYEGSIGDRAQLAKIYREARGFVLLSAMESLSLSALEAAACGCPLLLSDLPWARETFGEQANYCPVTAPERMAGFLKKFYTAAPSLKSLAKPLTWIDVAQQLKTVYERVLNTSR